jgi:hypothetical protein
MIMMHIQNLLLLGTISTSNLLLRIHYYFVFYWIKYRYIDSECAHEAVGEISSVDVEGEIGYNSEDKRLKER